MTNGDNTTIYSSQSRIRPLPSGPYLSAPQAYRASKALALDAAETFMQSAARLFSRSRYAVLRLRRQ